MNVSALNQFKSTYKSGTLIPLGAINDIGKFLSNITGRNGVRVVNNFGQGIYIELDETVTHPWKVNISADNSVTVQRGYVTRNGTKVSSDVDSGEEYYTITGLSATSATYYIYIELLRPDSLADPTLYPSKITPKKTTSDPSNETFGTNIYFVLATVTTDADGICTTVNQRMWQDIDDQHVVPDSNSSFDATDYKRYYSTQWAPRADSVRHTYDLQIYNFDLATSVAPDGTGDLLMYREKVEYATGKYFYRVQYCTVDALASEVFDYVDFTEEPWATQFANAVNSAGLKTPAEINSGHLVTHNGLDSTTGTGSHDFADGHGATNDDHDKRYPPNYVSGSIYDTKNYRTTGNWWMSEIHVSADGTTDSQSWTATILNVAVSGAMTIDAGAASTIKANGLQILGDPTNTANLVLGVSTNSWVDITAYATGSIEFTAADHCYWKPAVSNTADFLFGDATQTWKDYKAYIQGKTYINGTECLDIANWFENGWLITPSAGTIMEIAVGDANPATDRILVRRT